MKGVDASGDTTGTGISNNTAQGKAYINSSVYPSSIRFGNWNISWTNNKQDALQQGTGEINFFANNSGYINRANDSLPFTRSGCFRINGDNDVNPAGTSAGRTIPGTIHIGSECTQGWTQAYIDINDVNQNTSTNTRLMQFFWNNKGPGNGIGLSMRLDSKAASILQDLNYGFTGPGNAGAVHSLMRFNIVSFVPNNTLPVGTVRYIDIVNPVLGTASIGKLVGISILPPGAANKMRGLAVIEVRQNVLSVQGLQAGLVMGRQTKSAAVLAGKHNRSYAVLSEGNPIQLSAGTPYIYNGPFITTDNWFNITIGNVSKFYNYDKDILVTQFAGRTSGLFNLTKMSKRQYNLSFADYILFNDTLKIGGNTTHSDVKIDKTNFTIKSFNTTAYLNCAYFKSVNDGTIKLICDGVAV